MPVVSRRTDILKAAGVAMVFAAGSSHHDLVFYVSRLSSPGATEALSNFLQLERLYPGNLGALLRVSCVCSRCDTRFEVTREE